MSARFSETLFILGIFYNKKISGFSLAGGRHEMKHDNSFAVDVMPSVEIKMREMLGDGTAAIACMSVKPGMQAGTGGARAARPLTTAPAFWACRKNHEQSPSLLRVGTDPQCFRCPSCMNDLQGMGTPRVAGNLRSGPALGGRRFSAFNAPGEGGGFAVIPLLMPALVSAANPRRTGPPRLFCGQCTKAVARKPIAGSQGR